MQVSFRPFRFFDCKVAAGLTYRDMYMGRQNLPEPWRMPQRWEADSAEMALEDLDKVRLVLSFRGLNLLSNSYEPFFICVQVRPHMHLRAMHAFSSCIDVPQGLSLQPNRNCSPRYLKDPGTFFLVAKITMCDHCAPSPTRTRGAMLWCYAVVRLCDKTV